MGGASRRLAYGPSSVSVDHAASQPPLFASSCLGCFSCGSAPVRLVPRRLLGCLLRAGQSLGFHLRLLILRSRAGTRLRRGRRTGTTRHWRGTRGPIRRSHRRAFRIHFTHLYRAVLALPRAHNPAAEDPGSPPLSGRKSSTLELPTSRRARTSPLCHGVQKSGT